MRKNSVLFSHDQEDGQKSAFQCGNKKKDIFKSRRKVGNKGENNEIRNLHIVYFINTARQLFRSIVYHRFTNMEQKLRQYFLQKYKIT